MAFTWRKIPSGVGRAIGLHSLAGTFVVGGTASLGMMLALFQSEIRRAFPVPFLLDGVTNFPGPMVKSAIFFWFLFALVLLVAWLKEKYRAKEAKELHQETKDLHGELHQNIDDLKEITLTMPPKDYLERYAEQYRKISDWADMVFFSAQCSIDYAMENDDLSSLTSDRQMTDETIRAILDAILNLAQVFDAPHNSDRPRYSAGISWVMEPSDMEGESLEKLWELAELPSRHPNIGSFMASATYLLVNDINLSTTRDNDLARDEHAEPWVMAWENSPEPTVHLNLPGPLQVVDGRRYALVEDTHTIHSELREYGDSARERVHRFFLGQSHRRSSLSLALQGVSPYGPEDDPKPIAVLTLYRDVPGIMVNAQRADMFVHQITPFLSPLFRLCWIRLLLDYCKGRRLEVYTEVHDASSGEESDDDAETEEAS